MSESEQSDGPWLMVEDLAGGLWEAKGVVVYGCSPGRVVVCARLGGFSGKMASSFHYTRGHNGLGNSSEVER